MRCDDAGYLGDAGIVMMDRLGPSYLTEQERMRTASVTQEFPKSPGP